MTATLIDGKAVALELTERITQAVSSLESTQGVIPGLAVVLVGEDPASAVYVNRKGKACKAAGIASFERRLPENTSKEELLSVIRSLNSDNQVHGILCQLPLPSHLDEQEVIATIAPEKDVDGFHISNAGKLAVGDPTGFVPCTPWGSLILLRQTLGSLSGANALVIGRSNIVGKPMASLLIQESCTVTVAHSRTRNLADLSRSMDIVIAAVGRPEMVRGDWIREGATVIDVGINRIDANDQSRRGGPTLVGDVHFEEASARAGAITPVPGGVGPMTIACLLRNTVAAACLQTGQTMPSRLDGW